MVTTRKRLVVAPEQPKQVCYKCGAKHGSFRAGTSNWHQANCGVCGEWQACTLPVNFGYLLVGWQQEPRGEDLD